MSTASDGPSIDDEQVVEELARVFSDPDEAKLLATRAGVPASQVPEFKNSMVFWARVAKMASDGLLPGGLRQLVDMAARMRPFNEFFGLYERAKSPAERDELPPGKPEIFFALGRYALKGRLFRRSFTPEQSFREKHVYKPREVLCGFVHSSRSGHVVILHHTESIATYMRVYPDVSTPEPSIEPMRMLKVIDGFATLPRSQKRFLLFWSASEERLAPLLAMAPGIEFSVSEGLRSKIAAVKSDPDVFVSTATYTVR